MADAFFVDVLELTSVSPAEVDDNGGTVLSLVGKFADGPLQVFILINGVEVPCYSGAAGNGYWPRPTSGTQLSVVTPPMPRGGPYTIRVRQDALGLLTELGENILTEDGAEIWEERSNQADLIWALMVRNRHFKPRALALRQLMLPKLNVGPRRLDETDPLAADDPDGLLLENGENLLTETFENLQTDGV